MLNLILDFITIKTDYSLLSYQMTCYLPVHVILSLVLRSISRTDYYLCFFIISRIISCNSMCSELLLFFVSSQVFRNDFISCIAVGIPADLRSEPEGKGVVPVQGDLGRRPHHTPCVRCARIQVRTLWALSFQINRRQYRRCDISSFSGGRNRRSYI